MTQMNEAAAASLSPERATELARVLELQARWENLAAEPEHSTARLQGVQKAFDAYRSRLLAYTARDRGRSVTEMSLSGAGRLGSWCRTVRAVFLRAEGAECPTQLIVKLHRAAERIAARLKADAPGKDAPADLTGAIRQLDAVIAWCDGLDGVARPAGASYEVGGGQAGPARVAPHAVTGS